jgi:hypothetical protein
MELLGAYRKFRRWHDGVVIWFDLDEWPPDLPLPTGVKLMKTGEGPFRPNWHIVLEADSTNEMVGGWFILPMSLDGALEWYETEMEKRGWVKSTSYRSGNSAGIHFEMYEPRIHVELSFLGRPDLGDSTVMIRRYVKHPWSPPKSNGARVKPRGVKSKAIRTKARKPRTRTVTASARKRKA